MLPLRQFLLPSFEHRGILQDGEDSSRQTWNMPRIEAESNPHHHDKPFHSLVRLSNSRPRDLHTYTKSADTERRGLTALVLK